MPSQWFRDWPFLLSEKLSWGKSGSVCTWPPTNARYEYTLWEPYSVLPSSPRSAQDLEEEDVSGGFWFFIIGYNMRTNTAVCFSRSKCVWHFLRITKISHFFPFIWSKHLKITTKYTIPSRHSSDMYQAWATRMTGNAMESVLCQLKSVCVYVLVRRSIGKERYVCFISRFPHSPQDKFFLVSFPASAGLLSGCQNSAKFPAKQTCILVTCCLKHLHLILPSDLSRGMNRA